LSSRYLIRTGKFLKMTEEILDLELPTMMIDDMDMFCFVVVF
jgi:hypothetical protein